MERITDRTTINNYGWPTAWYVNDTRKPCKDAKRDWMQKQGIEAHVETIGGWAFQDVSDAMMFEMVWLHGES